MSRALSTVLRPVVVPITRSGSPVRKEPSKFRQLHTRVCYSWFFKKRRSTYVKASGLRRSRVFQKVYACSTLFDRRLEPTCSNRLSCTAMKPGMTTFRVLSAFSTRPASFVCKLANQKRRWHPPRPLKQTRTRRFFQILFAHRHRYEKISCFLPLLTEGYE